MSVTTQVYATAEDLAVAVATRIADGIARATAENRRYLLGCPSGRTPHPTYRALGAEVKRRNLNLESLVLVMMDDYARVEADGSFDFVPTDAHYSCHRFSVEEIQACLNAGTDRPILPEHVWFPDPKCPGAYDDRLREAGGVDLFILASGATDGHVGFNTVGSGADSVTRVMELPESTKRDNLGTFPEFGTIADVPSYGLSVGVATIRDLSKSAVMIITSAEKREAFRRITTATHYVDEWPATVITECRNAVIVADAAAAGQEG